MPLVKLWWPTNVCSKVPVSASQTYENSLVLARISEDLPWCWYQGSHWQRVCHRIGASKLASCGLEECAAVCSLLDSDPKSTSVLNTVKSAFLTFTVLSYEPETIFLPSKQTHLTAAKWPTRTAVHFSVVKSHTRSVLSREPETTWFPDRAMHRTVEQWP